jgi:hypothetical protein
MADHNHDGLIDYCANIACENVPGEDIAWTWDDEDNFDWGA